MTPGGDPTADLIREAEALAERAEAQIQQLEAERIRLGEQIATLRAYVRRVRPEPRTRKVSAARTPRQRPAKPPRPGPIATAEIANAILSFPGESFDIRDIAGASGRAKSLVRSVIGELRSGQIVVAAERKKRPGAPVPSQYYRIHDREALGDYRLGGEPHAQAQ